MKNTMDNVKVELKNLVDTIQAHLPSIQHQFGAYQNAFFAERPREFFALELCGEAGELANLEKKRWRGQEIEIGRFEEEAADVVIALVNYCNSAGLDLSAAVAQKVVLIPPSKKD